MKILKIITIILINNILVCHKNIFLIFKFFNKNLLIELNNKGVVLKSKPVFDKDKNAYPLALFPEG